MPTLAQHIYIHIHILLYSIPKTVEGSYLITSITYIHNHTILYLFNIYTLHHGSFLVTFRNVQNSSAVTLFIFYFLYILCKTANFDFCGVRGD